ncbi:hypothetical protein FO440_23965 [Mucilaginibacter corticis]|uniref:Glycosyltransferase family 2 protein n=1 Tax=Mucilaginibacter corticis TaxID=2597670 RepID=A0A556M861_9SPHI|nr:hypothetical protein [Mucilaginibacter corticis]TSJ35976.1 hypothetical protein FO440_23965 [Mucilaginibacter corticis]
MDKVSLQINLAPGDFLYARHILKHQLSILAPQVDEIILTVETKASKGRFSGDWAVYRDQLTNFIVNEVQNQFNARIVWVDYSTSAKRLVGNYFFGGEDVPEKDFRGGPYYAYFYGLLMATNDLVLHLDADMFLGGGSQTWVGEARAFFKKDSSCFIVSPLPGPPHPDDILINQDVKLKLASYTYSLNGMSTRIFMIDKARFRTHKLSLRKPPPRNQAKAIFNGNPNAELPENILSGYISKHQLTRIDFLGSGVGLWSLHPPYRTQTFFDHLPALVRRIESGDLPDAQRGFYDIIDEVCDWSEARSKLKHNRWWKRKKI